jgi:hypothetical protein
MASVGALAASAVAAVPVREALVAFAAEWGRPPDAVAWCALALGVVLALGSVAPGAVRQALDPRLPPLERSAFLTLAAFAAAALSLGYIAFYLRGGPRIIDATTYFLQGRALSEGHFAWAVPEPGASFRGRFLLTAVGDGGATRIGGIFPPGYPLLLALGFAIGAPMVVGPALAAAIVLATYALARELARDAGLDAAHTESVARGAALVSVSCAALRYHTADTMAHGAAALGITLAATAALRARRTGASRLFVLAGLGAGYVAATRLASALPIACVTVWLASGAPRPARALLAASAGLVPGLSLLLLAQHAATGDALASTQRAYYAVSDGPPGCFRYGFGAGVGCMYEHGDFVRARLADGFGLLAALGTTARRLRMHLADVANLELLAPLVLVPLASRMRRGRGVRAALALVAGQVVSYAPFYFDGSYPGGGARFYADVLPVEHALLALGLVAVAARIDLARKTVALIAAALVGFAVHAANGHVALANRDGGRPMFEPDRVADAGVTRGLLFIDTDHGWNLAHDPAAASASASSGRDTGEGLVVARLRNDDHDRLLAEVLGRPAYVYRFDPAPPAAPLGPGATVGDLVRAATPRGVMGSARIDPWFASEDSIRDRGPTDETWRFESEADWPPIAQSGGWAEPIWMSGTCASGGRALAIHPTAATSEVRIALPTPSAGEWIATPHVVRTDRDGAATVRIVSRARGELARWTLPETVHGAGGASLTATVTCEALTPRAIVMAGAGGGGAIDDVDLVLTLTGVTGLTGPRAAPLAYPALDRTTLTRASR